VLLLLLCATPALATHNRRLPRVVDTVPGCTHFASHTGTGAACTRDAPCPVRTWTENPSLAQPGRTLCLLPGHYTQGSGRVVVPDTVNGTSASRIWIRAEQPGTVLIDGGDSARPVDVLGDWIGLYGLNACCGDNYNVAMRGSDGYVKAVVAWNAGQGGDGGFRVTGCRNVFEDIAHFGTARYPISATQEACGGNIVRRAWIRWEGNGHQTSNPSASAILGYGQDRLLFENLWLTWHYTSARNTSPEGVGAVWSTVDSQWYGSIAYLTPTSAEPPRRLFTGYVDGGSHAQQGDFHPTQNYRARHNLAVVAPSHPLFAESMGFYFVECSDPGCLQGSNNRIEDSVGITGTPGTFSVSWTPHNLQQGRSIAEAIGAGKNVWTESVASPGLCYRYVNGQPTTQPLWPWAMDRRVSDALVAAGYPALDVTQEIAQVVGQAIPDQCRWDRQPPPEPEPPQPGPGALTCRGELGAAGKIALECVPQEGER
jgi:hypothetical protein